MKGKLITQAVKAFILMIIMFISRGFSTIELVENTFTKKRYALKRIICHSIDDQKIALQEIEYYKKLKHPNIIELIDSTFKGICNLYKKQLF